MCIYTNIALPRWPTRDRVGPDFSFRTMPDSAKPLGCTCFALRKVSRAVTRLYDQHLARAGLKTTQYSLLRWIATGPMPIATLAAKTTTDRTTLTRSLRPMVDAGWVALRSGADARQRIVTITTAGRQVIEVARSAWRAAQAELEGAVGNAAVRALHERLDMTLDRIQPLLGRDADVDD
jgi:DNA-binding MarR family transcriptional regulator